MSKRVQFEDAAVGDDDLEKAFQGDGGVSKTKASRFKDKHSLDSDEEDNVDKYDVMAEDDIEGQEDGDVNYEEGTRFTPFNMKEELEEGHFDTDGMYIFDKEKDIKDHWMDNIDWVKIKETNKNSAQDGDSDSDEESQIDTLQVLKDMLGLMLPGETVLKALKRLGGGKNIMSASERWKKKKANKGNDATNEEEEKLKKENLLKLTGLADLLLQHGDHDIYQNTYEKLQFKIKVIEDKDNKKQTKVPEEASVDDALDIFADSWKDDEKKKDTETDKVGTSKPDAKQSKKNGSEESTVQWEYKWSENDSETHGPFSTQQMIDWQDDEYFKDTVVVRRTGTETFYLVKRIDFELYT